MLKAFTSYLSANRSLKVKVLKAPRSKRFWKGPRNMLRPPDVEPFSKVSQVPVLGSHGGTPFVPGAKAGTGPKAAGSRTGFCPFTPVVPCSRGFFGVGPPPPTRQT